MRKAGKSVAIAPKENLVADSKRSDDLLKARPSFWRLVFIVGSVLCVVRSGSARGIAQTWIGAALDERLHNLDLAPEQG